MKVKFPIGVRLAIIIGLIVLISLGTVTFLNSYFIAQDVKITAENNNFTTNSRAAASLTSKISVVRSNTFQLLDLLNVFSTGTFSPVASQAQAFFYERNPDIAAIYILSSDATDMSLLNKRFFSSNEIEEDTMTDFLSSADDVVHRSCAGEVVAVNASPFLNLATMALFLPWKENGKNQSCCIVFSLESLQDSLAIDTINTTFVINDKDELLFHPDMQKVLIGESFTKHPLVQALRTSNQNNAQGKQIPFVMKNEGADTTQPTTEGTNENTNKTKQNKNKLQDLLQKVQGVQKQTQYFGAFQTIDTGNITVLTCVPMDVVLEAVNTTKKNNIYLTGVVFFLSIILVLVFTRFGISRHLRKLTQAANEIQKGNFETDIFSTLNTKRTDEIGVLNQSTKDEISFLSMFSKFTNKAVAQAIAKKDIDFQPHLKDITIFFSDIRGFTQISDGFNAVFKEESPKHIINFLNDYMSRMVDCITLSGGNVDKFEGDAIMAVWGLLREDSLDFENLNEGDPNKLALKKQHTEHIISDALNAIKGTVAMRYALMKYNKDARNFSLQHKNDSVPVYKPHIRIGCGLNCGRSTCGIMGSKDKMEYTAIGDAVNFASRTESSNKPCGTDILITQDMFDMLKARYIKCPENNYQIKQEFIKDEIIIEKIPVSFDVKGKGEQHFYGVVNMPGFDLFEFFSKKDKNFKIEDDCAIIVGKNGPKTLDEVRQILGIATPEYEKVDLNEAESKIKVKQ